MNKLQLTQLIYSLQSAILSVLNTINIADIQITSAVSSVLKIFNNTDKIIIESKNTVNLFASVVINFNNLMLSVYE